MPKRKNYKPGECVEIGRKRESGKVLRRRCPQCRCISMVEGENSWGPWEACANNCGPEALQIYFKGL